MSLVRIDVDQQRTRAMLERLSATPQRARVAMARALNASASKARTEIVRRARSRFSIKADRARKTITIHRASVSTGSPFAMVSSSERRQPLTRFRVTPSAPKSWAGLPNARRRPYVKVSVGKGKSTLLRHAFLARFSSGHVGVFERSAKYTSGGRRKLVERYGPAVPQMLGGITGAEAVAEVAAQKFYQELDRQVGVLLKG